MLFKTIYKMHLVQSIGYYPESALSLNYSQGFYDLVPLNDPLYTRAQECCESSIMKIGKPNKPYNDNDIGDKLAGNGKMDSYMGYGTYVQGYGLGVHVPGGSMGGTGVVVPGDGYTRTFQGQGMYGLGNLKEELSKDDNMEGDGIVDTIRSDKYKVGKEIVGPFKKKLNRLKKYPIKQQMKMEKVKPILPGERLKKKLQGKGKKRTGSSRNESQIHKYKKNKSQLNTKLRGSRASRAAVYEFLKRLKGSQK